MNLAGFFHQIIDGEVWPSPDQSSRITQRNVLEDLSIGTSTKRNIFLITLVVSFSSYIEVHGQKNKYSLRYTSEQGYAKRSAFRHAYLCFLQILSLLYEK